jgi:hypothetical protein
MATTVVSELINEIGFSVNQSQLSQVESSFESIRNRAAQVGRTMTAAITAPLAAIAAVSIKAASDSVETQNKFNQVFGSISEDANKFATQLSTDLRRSNTGIQDNLASLQSFAVGMGFAEKEAFKFSTSIQKMVFDFASFNNISDDDSFQRFIAGLSGSGEVFDRFGINIKDAALGLELQALGLAESTAKATEMQKVIARVSIIQKALGKQGAIGDASRTMFEFASAIKSARSVIADLLSDFGTELLPIAKSVVNTFNDWAIALRNKLTPEMKRIILVVGFIVAAVGPLLLVFAGLATAASFIASAFGALSAAAVAANTTVGLLVAKFILIGLAIAAVGIALALVIEDILVFQRGGNSLIGFLIDKFGEFTSFLESQGSFILGIFSDIFGGIRDTFDGLIEFITGVFMGKWRFAIQSLGKVLISALTTAINAALVPFQAVLDVFNQITGKKVSLRGVAGGLGAAANRGLQSLTAPTGGLPSTGFNARQIAVDSQRNFNVNSNINMSFPVGTDQSTIDSAQQQIKKAVRDELMFEVRKVVTDNPKVQR